MTYPPSRCPQCHQPPKVLHGKDRDGTPERPKGTPWCSVFCVLCWDCRRDIATERFIGHAPTREQAQAAWESFCSTYVLQRPHRESGESPAREQPSVYRGEEIIEDDH
jgi:hypothetical protein